MLLSDPLLYTGSFRRKLHYAVDSIMLFLTNADTALVTNAKK